MILFYQHIVSVITFPPGDCLVVGTGITQMAEYRSLDGLVRARLREWPQRPPGLRPAAQRRDSWLRARPSEVTGSSYPFLKLPGSQRLRTLPDGLWLYFGGTPLEPFVDIFAIEACGSLPNMLDKRARFAPSTNSLLAVGPMPWLLGPTSRTDATPRWQTTGVFRAEPVQPLIAPVRDIRVLFALKQRHYNGLQQSHVPHAHEYFVPMDKLVAKDAPDDPELQALVARASSHSHFLTAV
jgi:hypothetical protein